MRGKSITGAPLDAMAETRGSLAHVDAAKGDEATEAGDFLTVDILVVDSVKG